MLDPEIADLRQEYNRGGLRRSDVGNNPFAFFRQWLDDAKRAGMLEPNAMTLSTVNSDGEPSARIVLLKALDDQGFVFFTNYDSRKGGDIASTGKASLVFWWDKLERQVRITGRVEKVAPEDSVNYFASRPRASQLGAVASPQSRVVDGREALEGELAAAEAEFSGRDVERPEHWGGYRVIPDEVEFWVGRRSRLHDRVLCKRSGGSDEWLLSRLGA